MGFQRISFKVNNFPKIIINKYYNFVITNSIEDHSAASYILVAVMISLLVVSALVGALVCRITKRRSNLVVHRKLSLIHPTTPPLSTGSDTQKNILLLWFRDNTQLMQQVELLKSEMLNHLNAKVSF